MRSSAGGEASGQASPTGASANPAPPCTEYPESTSYNAGGAGGGGGGHGGGGAGYWDECFVFGTAAGGGGGSSLVDPSMTASAYGTAGSAGNGLVTVTLHQAKGPTSMSAISSSPASLVLGDTATFAATVTPGVAGVRVPTGTVHFTLDGVDLGALSVLDGSGSATSAMSQPLGLGPHTVIADYSGDAGYLDTSVTTSFSVSPTSSTVALSFTPDPLSVGDGVTVTATVMPGWAAGPVPTGTVTFTLDGAPVGCPRDTPGGCPQEMNAAGAVTTGPSEPVSYGGHALVATYSGDGNYQPSTATRPLFAVDEPSLVLVPSHNPVLPPLLETLTFTATVQPSGGVSDVPTGTVRFSVDDGAALVTMGGTPLSPVALAGGVATTPTIDQSKLSFGYHTVVAAYSGDDHFAPGDPTSVQLLVLEFDATQPTPLPTARGGAGGGCEVNPQPRNLGLLALRDLLALFGPMAIWRKGRKKNRRRLLI